MNDAALDAHLAAVAERGYTIVEDAFDAAFADELLAELEGLEARLGTIPAHNSFEDAATWRVYNLLVRGPVWARIPVWPEVLPIVEGVLDTACLVSSLSSIAIGPGEEAQPIHADDALMPIPRPHPAAVCNSMCRNCVASGSIAASWATSTNGRRPTRSWARRRRRSCGTGSPSAIAELRRAQVPARPVPWKASSCVGPSEPASR
jgi:hypothetical protein